MRYLLLALSLFFFNAVSSQELTQETSKDSLEQAYFYGGYSFLFGNNNVNPNFHGFQIGINNANRKRFEWRFEYTNQLFEKDNFRDVIPSSSLYERYTSYRLSTGFINAKMKFPKAKVLVSLFGGTEYEPISKYFLDNTDMIYVKKDVHRGTFFFMVDVSYTRKLSDR